MGDSGAISMKTGSATGGRAGALNFQVGSTKIDKVSKTINDGGNILMSAGLTLDTRSTGGKVTLVGGEGRHRDIDQGGSGGGINLKGGASWGGSMDRDSGGHIDISGGYAVGGSGGDVHLRSGISKMSKSGNIGILTPHGGNAGQSGRIGVVTGLSKRGDSGGILLQTGHASEKSRRDRSIEGGSGECFFYI